MLPTATLIAQAQSQPQQPGAPMGTMLFPLLLMGVIFYFILIRPQSKERRKREDMLKQIKKNDRVITVGGVMGTVQSVRDDEVTLKVDESSNTKITFTRSAIQRIVSAGPAEATEGK